MCYELKKGVPINEVLGDLNFWFRNDRMSKSRLKKHFIGNNKFNPSYRTYEYTNNSLDSFRSYFDSRMLFSNNANKYYFGKYLILLLNSI